MAHRRVPRDAPASTLFSSWARTAMQNARALHEGAPVALALSLTPFAAWLQSNPSRPALARESAAIDILFDPR
jgi:hypothetical protein